MNNNPVESNELTVIDADFSSSLPDNCVCV